MKTTIRIALAGTGLAVLLSACETTRQTRSTKVSGFLGDYSQLEEGGGETALMRYINPSADFKKYTKVWIDPIQVYAGSKSKLEKLPQEELQSLVNYLDAALREELKGDYRLVKTSGADVMRLRVAITEAKGSKVVLDTISSVLPPGMAISALMQVGTGTPSAVGRARVEAELLDSVSGERLMAGVDERSGRKYTGKLDKWKTWQDAQDAYDHWARQLKLRLAELRAR